MALKFTLITTALAVTLDGGEYEIREMTAAARDAYMDTLSERVVIDKEGKAAGIKKFDGMQAELVSRCLFLKSDGSQVTKETIQGWPASTVASLFDECQTLNHLNTGAQKAVAELSKNE